ncbi:hypothetical protein QYF61_023928 [Mycteria americana]|uniref:Uncharacterized protein n=1 Tax=Mycteria americana TaxID=33587 RepID=A0AAN7PBE2_MYCAM|nr:hypothetical protein QYF61_023928 [Mycteria americana]
MSLLSTKSRSKVTFADDKKLAAQRKTTSSIIVLGVMEGYSWAEPTKEKQKIEHNAVKKGKVFLVTSDTDWRGVTYAERNDALCYLDSIYPSCKKDGNQLEKVQSIGTAKVKGWKSSPTRKDGQSRGVYPEEVNVEMFSNILQVFEEEEGKKGCCPSRDLLQVLCDMRADTLRLPQPSLRKPVAIIFLSDKPSHSQSFEIAKQPQLPQLLLIRLVLQTLHQLRCPSLDTLQHLNVPLVVRSPELNTVFEVRPHQGRVQGHDHFPSPAGHTIFDTSRDAIGLLGHLGTLLAHIQLAVNQHSQVISHQAAFQPLFLKPAALHGAPKNETSYRRELNRDGKSLYGRHMQANPEPPKKNNDKSKKISRKELLCPTAVNQLMSIAARDGPSDGPHGHFSRGSIQVRPLPVSPWALPQGLSY